MTDTAADDTVIPDDFGELKLLVWNGDPRRPIPAKEAFARYERDWRHVDPARMTDREKRLIADLSERFGKGILLV